MTLQELTHIVEMKTELARDEAILQRLKDTAYPASPMLSGMPHSTGIKDKVGDLAADIADMQDIVNVMREKVAVEENRVIDYISRISDGRTRMIFRFRFLHGMSWKEVAAMLGKWESESTVKQKCYEYIGRHDT